MESEAAQSVLQQEQHALDRIQSVHEAEVDRMRLVAAGLADEAAIQTEDGIRDLVDPDAEVDAAVEAAMVRQTSQRAIAAARRVAELESRGRALAFGHITDEDGERLYVGRFSVIEGDEPLLVDWRARASTPFYRATPLEPLGTTHRRHLLYGDGITRPASDLVSYSDEIFDLDRSTIDAAELQGEAALLASLDAPTPEMMRSVVATIQSEQDAIIRAPSKHPLLVQGGPGTGKTVVALHRAAYLLYDEREALADTGVLIVGPSSAFIRYISDVLPSLGESGVVSLTVPELYVGVRLGHKEPDEVARLKGTADMVPLLARAVADRQRRPTKPLRVFYGSVAAELSTAELQAIFSRAQRFADHNDGANEFRQLVVEQLMLKLYDPNFTDRKDLQASLLASRPIKRFVLRHFPPLNPEQALNDLCGSKALLRSAATGAGLDPSEAVTLYRERTPEHDLESRRWSNADVPLLDELFALLGGAMGQSEQEREAERDAADAFELAARQEAKKEISIDPTERPDDPDDLSMPSSYDDPYYDPEGEFLVD